MEPTRTIKEFQRIIRSYFRRAGRDLPWRRTRNPYRILISEVMLQQTQVQRVIPFYHRFLKRFPTPHRLARAKLRDVLVVWSGLGYNRRARYLRDAAVALCREHACAVPHDSVALERLPGIGRYSARAISTFAFGSRNIFIETNIRSVFIHHFFRHRSVVHDQEIGRMIERTLPERNVAEWYWALMDYGAHLKQQGVRTHRQSRAYAKQAPFTGSLREARGKILRMLETPRTTRELSRAGGKHTPTALRALARDGLIEKRNGRYQLPA